MSANYKVAVIGYVINSISRSNQDFIYIITNPRVSQAVYTHRTKLSAIMALVANRSFMSENCLQINYYDISMTDVGQLRVDMVDDKGILAATDESNFNSGLSAFSVVLVVKYQSNFTFFCLYEFWTLSLFHH